MVLIFRHTGLVKQVENMIKPLFDVKVCLQLERLYFKGSKYKFTLAKVKSWVINYAAI